MIVFLIIIIIVALVVILAKAFKKPGKEFKDSFGRRDFEDPSRIAGREGEQEAKRIIQSVLRKDDRLFNNVHVTWEDKPAEFDNVIVNKYGVFIIEVKNYVGMLYGAEDDYEWSKYKTTSTGNTYERDVKNPIKQVKRQVYVMARYLEYYGCDVWVEGRAFLINGNSPVESEYMLKSTADIDRTIHTFGRNRLNAKTVDRICELLS